ncbi:MAG: exodeoxyribonuclease VII small subunit [Gammaproteobacteria bacterium]|jgi:exodeoxyribonuclease VII small subunit
MSENFDFNKGLTELEQIVKQMDSADLSLDESLKLFEKGVTLTKLCQKALQDTEAKISLLINDKD